MSWTVDGRTYHDYSEYQAALERKAAREASERANQAYGEIERYQRRQREQQAELERARGDLARQRNINEQMQQDVRGLEREQHQLAEAQSRFERESNARLSELRTNLKGMGSRLAEAEEEHRKHVEATHQAFVQASQALKAGLEEAEQRRQATEQRLKSAVAEVDRKVEHDRQERLRRQESDLDQAREQIAMVSEILDQLTSRLRPLNLEEDDHSVRMALQSAQVLHQQGKASPALAQAQNAFGEARALGYKSEKRRAELLAAATAVVNRVQAVREVVKSDQLDTYFKAEKAELIGHLARVANRLPQRYQQYSRMEDDLREDERVVGKLEEEARTMLAICPTLVDQIAERKQKISAIVRDLKNTYGGGAEVKPQQSDRDDPKSPLVVNCVFSGGAKVRIEADIDGEVRIDGAGHSSQDACNRRAAEVVQALSGQMSVTHHDTLVGNPSDLPDRASVSRGRSWQDVRVRLREIGSEL